MPIGGRERMMALSRGSDENPTARGGSDRKGSDVAKT